MLLFNNMKPVKLILIALIFVGCSKPLTIVVNNPSLDERTEVMAELPVGALNFTKEDIGKYRLLDENKHEVPYQILYWGTEDPQRIIFLVDNIRGGMQRQYTWRKGNPSPVEPRVSAQFVPERKDDFAWENDNAAYRMYGPALAPENPSNGVDLWLKCTDKPIVTQFYDDDLHHNRPYHINYGEGLDCYKVAHTLGCGGIAPYVDGHLQVGNHYEEWKILEEGPLRVQFMLTYPTHKLFITCDAGSLLNKAEVYREQEAESNNQWAAGIFLHDKMDNVSFSEQGGWLAYAENAVSDAGVHQGRNYCAVVADHVQAIQLQDQHLLAILPATEPATYYFGGGWSQWRYPEDADWFSAVASFARNADKKLKCKVQ